MSQRLFLVRHGRTGWNKAGRYLGTSDIDLDERGVAESKRLARWAASASLGTIVSSPAVRARHTAAIVAAQVGLDMRVDERFRELDFGAAEGRTLAELRAEDAEIVARFEMDPVEYHLPGGEHPRAALDRMQAAIRDLRSEPPARVLVVTHNTVLRLFVSDCLGIPLARYRRLLPVAEHCAITELGVTGDAFAVYRYNAAP